MTITPVLTAAAVGTDLDDQMYSDPSAEHTPFARVIITFRAVDPDNRTAKALASIRFADRNLDPVTFTNGDGCHLRVVDGSVQPADDCPIRGGDGSPNLDYNAKPLDLFLAFGAGEPSPTAFPQDQWVFDASAWLHLPYPVYVPAQDSPHRYGDMPLAIGFARDDRLEQWNLETRPMLTTDYVVGPSSQHFQVAKPYAVLSRPVNVWLFVYAIGVTPLILGCAYLVSQRRHTDESAAALSLAATLLSLLAIRQVVTPAEIHGLTRLDRLLGLELVVLVLVFTWRTTSWPRSRWSRQLGELRRSAGWGPTSPPRT
jgi:hypothetical protein